MKPFPRAWLPLLMAAFFLDPFGGPAWAIQGHGGAEGIVVHQFSHFLFVGSGAFMIHWLRSRDLVRRPGWRDIQYAVVLFIVWNLGAALGHFLDEQAVLVTMTRSGFRELRFTSSAGDALIWGYYLAKLDHLLCVPAMFLLHRGLRRLLADPSEDEEPETGTP